MGDHDLETLLETADLGELQLVKGLLDAAEIPFTVEGEGTLQTLPVRTPGFFTGRGLAALIKVHPEDLDDARALLAGEDPGGDAS
ncbi:MAG: DUF2007 domain-containing protein [Acidobacteriota bacterium]